MVFARGGLDTTLKSDARSVAGVNCTTLLPEAMVDLAKTQPALVFTHLVALETWIATNLSDADVILLMPAWTNYTVRAFTKFGLSTMLRSGLVRHPAFKSDIRNHPAALGRILMNGRQHWVALISEASRSWVSLTWGSVSIYHAVFSKSATERTRDILEFGFFALPGRAVAYRAAPHNVSTGVVLNVARRSLAHSSDGAVALDLTRVRIGAQLPDELRQRLTMVPVRDLRAELLLIANAAGLLTHVPPDCVTRIR